MSYVISLLIVVALVYVIVKNIISVVKTIKEKKQAKKETDSLTAVEVKTDVDLDKKD